MALDRQQVVAAAVELLDAEGPAKLSMRRLGRELGVEAMSLYRYVDSKAALLDAVHEHLLTQLPAPGDHPWDEALVAQAESLRALLAAHPGVVPLMATRAASTPGALEHVDELLTRLRAAGFSGDDALHAFQTVFVFVVGHAMFHLAPPAIDSEAARREFRWGLQTLVAGLRARR